MVVAVAAVVAVSAGQQASRSIGGVWVDVRNRNKVVKEKVAVVRSEQTPLLHWPSLESLLLPLFFVLLAWLPIWWAGLALQER